MRVKICGITTVTDALAAAEAGADAVGLNFVSGPRCIDVDRAEKVLCALPPFLTPVALVRVEQGRLPGDVAKLLARFRISHVQLYGEVTACCLAALAEGGLRPMPVMAVRNAAFAAQAVSWQVPGSPPPCAAAVILDAFDPQREGGTGKTLRWDWVADARKAGQLDGWPPVILAGGLHPGNVAEAVRSVQPYGVDVSSGVEVERAVGRKDPEKMRQFVHNAKQAAKRQHPT